MCHYHAMYYGEMICLRALEQSDLDEIYRSQNDWDLRRLHGVPLPKSMRFVAEWLEKAIMATPWTDGVLTLAITDKSNDTFLGIIRLFDIKSPHYRAALGISIYDVENQSKGYGSDAIKVMLWVGFHVLGLHSIYLDTMEDNERAIRIFEKIGFKRVGILRETEFIEGEYRGLLVMDILRDEFMRDYPPSETMGVP